MTERDNYIPEAQEVGPETSRNLSRAALELLYITGDPRGIAALPENVEYDIREIPLPPGLSEIDESQT